MRKPDKKGRVLRIDFPDQPKDVVIHCAGYDFAHQAVQVMLWSEEYPILNTGEEAPLIKTAYEPVFVQL